MGLTRTIILEPPGEPGRSARALFLRDRFSIWAFLFTFLWLFRYGLWLSGLLVLLLAFGIGVLGGIDGFGSAAVVLSILLASFVALEGPMLRARRLRRQGWREAAAFHAANRDEAELIYYARSAEPAREFAAPSQAFPWKRPGAPARLSSGGGLFGPSGAH